MHMQMVSPDRQGRRESAVTSRAAVDFLVHHHTVMVHKEVRYGARPWHRSLARPKKSSPKKKKRPTRVRALVIFREWEGEKPGCASRM